METGGSGHRDGRNRAPSSGRQRSDGGNPGTIAGTGGGNSWPSGGDGAGGRAVRWDRPGAAEARPAPAARPRAAAARPAAAGRRERRWRRRARPAPIRARFSPRDPHGGRLDHERLRRHDDARSWGQEFGQFFIKQGHHRQSSSTRCEHRHVLRGDGRPSPTSRRAATSSGINDSSTTHGPVAPAAADQMGVAGRRGGGQEGHLHRRPLPRCRSGSMARRPATRLQRTGRRDHHGPDSEGSVGRRLCTRGVRCQHDRQNRR